MAFPELDRQSIRTLVEDFYDTVRADPEIGPIFNGAIHDWPAHLERLTGFWATVMLGSREFQGNVFGTHMQIEGVRPEHFRRWLGLFDQATSKLCDPALAAEFMTVARRIAGSLQYGYYGKIEVQ